MNPSDQNFPLEKLFIGTLLFLGVLALVVLGVVLLRLAKLARGPGRSPYRASVSDLDLPAMPPAPVPPSASVGSLRDPVP